MDGLCVTLYWMFLVLTFCGEINSATDEDYGKWDEWSKWGSCDSKCGNGNMKRIRTWIPGPSYDGEDVPFTRTHTVTCVNMLVPICPKDGEWSMWSPWPKCKKPCGQETRTSIRVCGGRKYQGTCDGDDSRESSCNNDPCPALPANFRMSQCTAKNFTCASNKMCITGDARCDKTVQCHDGSDEIDCHKVKGGGASTVSLTKVLMAVTVYCVITSLAIRVL